MATDKRFVVKNGLQTENINFVFNDAVLGSSNITATMLSSNTLSFSGTTGQLFSITDSMTGVIFAVNDISGVPSIEVYDDGRVYFAETFGNVTIGNSVISSNRTSTSTTTGILQVAGGAGITGNLNVGGTRNLFTGSVGIGTSTALGTNANVFSVYGSAMVYGNLDLANPAGGTSGIYFNDGTYQTTAFTGAATPSFGTAGTIQYAGAGNTFSGNSDSFFWDSANSRLGIGTNSPTNVLTVRSTATPAWFNTVNSAIGSNNFEIIVGNGTSTGTTVGYVNNTLVPYGYLSAGTATRNITIAANGRVGIGGVTAPQVLLDIGGGTVIGSSWAGNSNFINPPTNGLAVQGSVGIGTYTPLSTLDVRGGLGVTAASNFGGALTVASLVSNGAIGGTTGTFTGALYGASFNTAGTATVNALVSNGAISGTTITGTAGTFTSIQNSGLERAANIVSNTWIHATQNLTVASSNASTSTTTGAAVITGGVGVGGNLNVGGTRSAFTGFVSVGAATVPNYALDVTGEIAIRGGSNPDDARVYFQADDNSNRFTIETDFDATTSNDILGFRAVAADNILVLKGNGFVGIGTSNPLGTLDIRGGLGVTSASNFGGALSVASLASNGAVSGTTGTFTGALYGASFNTAGTATVNALVSNTSLQTATVTASSTIQAAGTITGQTISSNTTVTAGTGITVTSGGINVTGASQFTGNVSISGNLNVVGTINTQNANVLIVNDPIIYLGEGNTGTNWDLGIVGNYNDGIYEHTGFVRNRADGVWTLFDTMTSEPNISTGNINWSDSTLTFAAMKLGNLIVAGNTRSTSSTTGAVVVNGVGGIGIGGNLNVGGAHSTTAGALTVGTATPGSVAFTVNGASPVAMDLRTGNFGWWRIESSSSANAGTIQIASQNSSYTPFLANGVNNTLTLQGNVGVGITSPTSRVEILTGIGLAGPGGGNNLTLRHSATNGNTMLLNLGVSTVSKGGANQGHAYLQAAYWGGSNNNPLLLQPLDGGVVMGDNTAHDWKLTVRGTTAIASNVNTHQAYGGRLAFPAQNYSGEMAWISSVFDGPSGWAGGAGLAFGTISGADVSGSDGVERMRISANGNIGVGTTLPLSSFDVASGQLLIPAGSVTVPGLAFRNSTGTGLYMTTNTQDGLYVAHNGNVVINFRDGGNYSNEHFVPNGDNTLNLGTFGNRWSSIYAVSFAPRIGTAASPPYRFDDGSANPINAGMFGVGNSTVNQLGFSTMGSERMRIDSNGNVGIATSSSNYRLRVQGTALVTGTLSIGTGADWDTNVITQQAGGGLSFVQPPNNPAYSDVVSYIFDAKNWSGTNTRAFEIRQQGVPTFTVATNGFVGIGTALPTSKLHVYSDSASDKVVFNLGAGYSPGTNTAGLNVWMSSNSATPTVAQFGFSNGAGSRMGGFAFSDISGVSDWAVPRMDMTQSYGGASEIRSLIAGQDATWAGMKFTVQTTSDTALTTSPAFVWNNYSTELMRITSSGNVGIGTTSPGAKLHVLSSSGSQGRFAGDANNYTDVNYDGFNTVGGAQLFRVSGTVRFRVATAAVGIGTTAEPSGPTASLVIRGTGTNGSGIQLANLNVAGSNIGVGGSNSLVFSTYTGAIGSETYTERMRMDSDGDLGIGTSVIPAGARLLVAGGNISLNSTGSPTGYGIVFPDGTFQTTASSPGAAAVGIAGTVQYSSGSGTFAGDATNFFWDSANTRLGIGTGAPSNSLTVWGATPAWFNTSSGSNVFEIRVGNATTTAATLGYASSTLNPYAYFRNVGGTNGIAVVNNGSVGIKGITNPQSALDVGGAVAIGTGYAGVTAAPTNGLAVQGNVGIGTTTATQRLEVRGWARIGLPGYDAGIEFEGGYGKIYRATATGYITIEPQTHTVFSTGNVGIGTAPDDPITIFKGTANTKVSLDDHGIYFSRPSDGSYSGSVYTSTSFGSGQTIVIDNREGVYLQYNTTTKLTVGNNGIRIGNGNTASTNILDVAGAATISNLSITNTTVSTSSTTGALIVGGGAGIGGNLFVNGTFLRIKNYMTSAVTGEMLVGEDTSGVYLYRGFNLGQANRPLYIGHVQGNIILSTNSQERMRIDGNGRVGIATTSPGSPLDVNGNASFGSAISTAGTATVNSLVSNGAISTVSVSDAAYTRIVNPGGGVWSHGTPTVTGALAITLPVAATKTMIQIRIKVYEYATNESFELCVGGYPSYGGNTWANSPFAYIVGNPSIDRRFNVRLGYTAGAKMIIYIGETTDTWSYPQVFVTEVLCGYGGQSASYLSGWSIGAATAFENVTATISSTDIQVGYAVSTNTANSVVKRDGSGNFSAGAITGTAGVFSTSLYGATFNTAGTATVNALVSNGAVSGTTGAFSGALTLTSAAPQINLNNGTSNWIAYSSAGVAAPTFTTRSVGTKLVLYPSVAAAASDYAIGIESATLWNSVETTSAQFKWYGGTTQAMLLSGAGALTTTSTTTSTAFIPSGSTVPTNGMFLPAANNVGFSTNSGERVRIDATGNIGIGTTIPRELLHLNNPSAAGDTPRIKFTNTNTGGGVSDGGFIGISNQNQIDVWNNEASLVRIGTSGTERMRVDASGNVSIGTTSALSTLTVQAINTTTSNTIDLRGYRSYTAATYGATSVVAVSDGTRNSHDFGAIRFEQNPNTSDGHGALFRMFVGGQSSSFASKNEFIRGTAITTTVGVDNIILRTADQERMRIDVTGNVGIGTSTIQTGYKLQVEGDFAATSKSFVINHPTKPGKMLRYGSLESPYHGIRLTGEAEVVDGKCKVDLPDYIQGLCKQEGAQVQITNIKHGKTLWIDEIDVEENNFTVKTRGKGKYRFYWSFTAIRKDIEDMLVEFDKH